MMEAEICYNPEVNLFHDMLEILTGSFRLYFVFNGGKLIIQFKDVKW